MVRMVMVGVLCWLSVLVGGQNADAAFVDLPVGGQQSVVTAPVAGLPSSFGGSDQYYTVVRCRGLIAGQRYELSFSFESGTDIGYAHAWVDGNPFAPDFRSFTGIGTGTGTGTRRESTQTFLFTVAPQSNCDQLYLVFRSSRPMTLRFSLHRPSGVTRDSRDRWGYYYVTDFDVDRTAPFLLTRCQKSAPPKQVPMPGGFVPVPVHGSATVTTAPHPAGLPGMFGPRDYYYTLFKLTGLVPGQRYEATLGYESGTNIGYGHTWVDGNPLGSNYQHFTGIGTGTGSGPHRQSQQKFLFTVAPASSSRDLYVVFSSNRPLPVSFALTLPSGVTRDSQDRWGYYYVTDFDADRTAPFLLRR